MHTLCTHALRATDLAAAKRWYSALTGTEPSFDMPFYVGFSVGGYELGIRPAPAPVAPGGATTYWGVDDLDAALARAIDMGATLREAAMDVGGGIRLGAVHDPFGNALGFIENPQFAVPTAQATVVADRPVSIAAADGALAPVEIHVSATVRRARADCFADWTDGARMSAWLGVPVDIGLRIGGPYELHFLPEAPAGSRGSDRCRVLSVLPGRMVSFTWNAPPTQPQTRLRHTWVVIQLQDAGPGQTRIDLHHTGWPAGGFGADGSPLADSPWTETHAYFAAAWPRMLGAYTAHCQA